MAKVIRNIEITEEEARALVKAYSTINSILDDLSITSDKLLEQLENICYNVTTGQSQSLNGETISDSYDDYEFKILERCDIEER